MVCCVILFVYHHHIVGGIVSRIHLLFLVYDKTTIKKQTNMTVCRQTFFYQFTNIIVNLDLDLHSLPHKNSHKVSYYNY